MIPAAIPIIAPVSSMWTQEFAIAGISDATGYSATLEIRAGWAQDSTLLSTVAVSSPTIGTRTIDGASLSCLLLVPKITVTNMGTLRTAAITAGLALAADGRSRQCYYSLVVTPPSGADDAAAYFAGTFTILEIP